MIRKISGAGCPAIKISTAVGKRMILPFTAMIMTAVVLGGCKRRPLTQADNNVIVNIEIEKEIVNYTYEEDPSMMRVMFFDNDGGDFATQVFLPVTGGTANVIPGQSYHVLTYNFDTESTVVGSEYNFHGIYATTNEVPESIKSRLRSRATRYDDELIVYEPDHHFVARLTDCYVPARSIDAPPVVINLNAETIVETWKVYIDRLQGLQWTASVAGVISGLSLSNTLASDEESDETASVFFETFHIEADGKLEIIFNTFGRNPQERQVLSLVVTDTGGVGHEFNFDVTEEFEDNPEQIIRIKTDKVVIDEPEIPDGGGGGLAPDVDEWDDIIIDIPI